MKMNGASKVMLSSISFRNSSSSISALLMATSRSLYKRLFIELLQFRQENLVFLVDILGICRDEEQQGRVAFNMLQETMSEPFAFGSSFDDPRNIRHHK